LKDRKGLIKSIYLYLVSLTGLWILLSNRPHFASVSVFTDVVFMFALVVLGELSPVPVPQGTGTISVSPPLMYTITVLYGPAIGIWVAVLATLRKRDLQGQVPLPLVLFNRGMLAISMLLFCKAFALLGGTHGDLLWPRGYIAFLAGAIVYTLSNATQFAAYYALHTGTSFIGSWNLNIRWSLPSMLALFPLGILMVMVVKEGGPLLLSLFYVPLMVTRFSLMKYTELRLAYQEMAGALSNAIDARDAYTRGHSERVAEYAAMLAKELRFPEDRIELIRYVGLLHDVGKIGIRDEIMKKQGTYTYEEYQEMKIHATMGAQMLQGMKFLGKGQDWVRHHHERWDGRGFPDGLKGEDIPIEARIIACADSFDAMTTDRPYKEKMTFDDARKELIRCKGTQFDPEVVKAMLRVIDKLLANGK
jgi:putative nucleotidyltransferase with HDIG domain